MGELIIDLLNERATYDGVTYPVDLFALLFLDVLNRRSGWLSEMEIKNTEPRLGAEKRFDRLRRKLPPKLAKLIEAKPGRGYRLRKPVQT